jgi:hypothetical protein
MNMCCNYLHIWRKSESPQLGHNVTMSWRVVRIRTCYSWVASPASDSQQDSVAGPVKSGLPNATTLGYFVIFTCLCLKMAKTSKCVFSCFSPHGENRGIGWYFIFRQSHFEPLNLKATGSGLTESGAQFNLSHK